MSRFHKTGYVSLGVDDSVEVSTIDLSISGMGTGYETCVFFGSGDSEVVEGYRTEAQALVGHSAWCHPAVVRLIKSVLIARANLFIESE